MKQLKALEEAEQILTETDMQDLIEPINAFPTTQEEMASLLGKKYVLISYQKGFIPSKTYMCVYENNQYVWKLINYTEDGLLDAPANVWAKSVRDATTGRATVYIHWDDPVDKDDAHWCRSVVIKKKGSEPTSIYDGEVVGYSSIRNQYSVTRSFVDSIDIDTVDDRDILDNSVLSVDPAERYWYKVFAVTQYGKVTGSEAFIGELTWAKLRELTRAGVADHALAIGDTVQVVHGTLGAIDFQVVAFDNAEALDEEGKKLEHSITFMSCDVLFRGSFDHQEEAYADTTDRTAWDADKVYYEYNNIGTLGQWDRIDTSLYASPNKYYEAKSKYPCERNPCWISESSNASLYGCNLWAHSNARAWLNSNRAGTTEDPIDSNWYAKCNKYRIWENYDTTDNGIQVHGTYGRPYITGIMNKLMFTGFMEDLESELKAVMVRSIVKTTIPMWMRELGKEDENTLLQSEDYVFLPSYVELFGPDDKTFPPDVNREEGKWFDIYSKGVATTRMKTVLSTNNTTRDKQRDTEDNLASWYMRTPVRMQMRDPGKDTSTSYDVDCIETITVESRRYDAEHRLGEDGATGRQAYMPARPAISTDKTDIPRDNRNDMFWPEGFPEDIYYNNTAPGFVPCFVVG